MKNIEKYQKLIAKGEVDALLLTSGEAYAELAD